MSTFSNKYQKTGFVYCLTISFIYLPLLFAILNSNQFIQNQFINLLIFISFTITFVTTINYKVILSTQESKKKFFVNKTLLPSLNILLILLIYLFLPFPIQENIFMLSLVFFGIPWTIYFLKIRKKHIATFKVE